MTIKVIVELRSKPGKRAELKKSARERCGEIWTGPAWFSRQHALRGT